MAIIPGRTSLDEVRQLLRKCSLVDPAATYEGSGYAQLPPGTVKVSWMCRDWQRSEDGRISNGYPNWIVARDDVVEWLLWRFDRAGGCSPSVSDVVDLHGAPEKILWAVAGYTPEIVWGDLVLLYPSKGLVLDAVVSTHLGSVQRGDPVITAYISIPISLDDLVRQPVQYDWQEWDFDVKTPARGSSWTEKLEDWPGFAP